MPLQATSAGRLDALLPIGLKDSTTHQLLVRRGNTHSLPEPVSVAATQPSVFTVDETGNGQVEIYVVNEDGTRSLSDSLRPAKAGERLWIYAADLGQVDREVRDGEAAPITSPASAFNPVRVMIQDREAQVGFAGLAPGEVGRYLIRVIVPQDLTPDPAAASPVETLAVSTPRA